MRVVAVSVFVGRGRWRRRYERAGEAASDQGEGHACRRWRHHRRPVQEPKRPHPFNRDRHAGGIRRCGMRGVGSLRDDETAGWGSSGQAGHRSDPRPTRPIRAAARIRQGDPRSVSPARGSPERLGQGLRLWGKSVRASRAIPPGRGLGANREPWCLGRVRTHLLAVGSDCMTPPNCGDRVVAVGRSGKRIALAFIAAMAIAASAVPTANAASHPEASYRTSNSTHSGK